MPYDHWLYRIAAAEVWDIGRASLTKIKAMGVDTVADLRDLNTPPPRRPSSSGYLSCMSEPTGQPPRCIHYVGFRDDRYWNAYRLFGGPRVIHRRWDFYATRDVGLNDLVVFAEGDEAQAVAERNATDLDERWL